LKQLVVTYSGCIHFNRYFIYGNYYTTTSSNSFVQLPLSIILHYVIKMTTF